jgi:hypothetical protein
MSGEDKSRKSGTERQHYVPQFLLRQFAATTNGRVHVYDMIRGISFQSGSRAVGAERDFYVFTIGTDSWTVDPSLTALEGMTSPIVRKIVDARSTAYLTDDERTVIAGFMAVQLVRTNKYRSVIDAGAKQVNELTRRMLRIHGREDGEPAINAENVKRTAIELTSNAGQYGPLLRDRPWILFEAPKSCPFYLSDNPVVLQNWNDFGPYGNLGLLSPGIQVYCPLSPTLMLGIVDPSVRGQISQVCDAFCGAFTSGNAVRLDARSVESYNELFADWSSRFVFSSISEFRIAEKVRQERLKTDSGTYETDWL